MSRRVSLSRVAVVCSIIAGCSWFDSGKPVDESIAPLLVRITPGTLALQVGETRQLTAQPLDKNNQPMSGLTLTWRAKTPAIVDVTSAGVVSGVSAGEGYVLATASNKDGSKTDSIRVTVTALPVIAATPGTLPFLGRQGGQNPQPQQITITNSGGGLLSGLTAVPSQPWIQAVFSGGVNQANPTATVLVTPLLAGLTAGSYSGTVQISSSLPNVAAKTVNVTLNLAPPPVASKIDARSVVDQSGSAGVAVAQPPSVLVRASDDTPVPGVAVTFAVAAGGGTIAPTTPVVTGADGVATLTSWTLGSAVNTQQRVTATATGLTGSPIAFNATTLGPTKIEIVSGNGQTGVEGNPLGAPVIVRLKDPNDRPVANWSVSFTAGSGGSASPSPATTNANGEASATWTLGSTTGSQALTATLTPATGSPVSVQLDATATGVVQIQKLAGDNQTGLLGAQLPTPLKVKILGANSTPIPGVAVTFAGNGSASPTPVTTNAAGEASTVWTLPASAGATASITASSGGVSTSFTATISKPATKIAALSLLDQSASAGAAVAQPPSVIARASDDTPVPGVSITFAVTLGGGTIVPTTPVVTDANGIATLTSWTLGPTANIAQRVTATATGLTGSPIAFNAITVGPSKIEIVSGNSQSGVAGNPLAAPIVVRVRDLNDKPVANWGIGFTPSNGGSASPNPATSNANGDASTTWTLGPVGGPQTLTATLTTVGGALVTVQLTATATGVVQVQKLAGDNQTGVLGTQLPTALKVKVVGANSTPIPGASVTFQGAGSASPTPVTTNTLGEASTFWTLPGTGSGTATMTATAGGVSANFTANLQQPPPGSITIIAGNGQSGRGCSPLPSQIVARVRDGNGVNLPGQTVTFTPSPGSGSSFSPASVVTDANGDARTNWTLGSTLGGYTATASVGSLSPAQLTATATLLCPNVGVFKGVVTKYTGGSSTGTPTAGTVKWTLKGTSTTGTLNTGADGVFSTPAIAAGIYILEASSNIGAFIVSRRYEETLPGGSEKDIGAFKVTGPGFDAFIVNITFSVEAPPDLVATVELFEGTNGDLAGNPAKVAPDTIDAPGIPNTHQQIGWGAGVNHGLYMLRVSAPGYQTVRQEVILSFVQTTNVTLIKNP